MLCMYRDSSGKTVVDISDCKTMRDVTVLRMSNLGLADFDMQLFSQLGHLEEMDVSWNDLDLIPECIQLPKLKRLDCSHNKLSDLQFVHQFPCLERLNTEGNPVTFADFCIASFLCPTIKLINNQTVNIQALNRKIENRAKPLMMKVWNDHLGTLYSSGMDDAEFDVLADKFRLLLKHSMRSSSKLISKFQDFRVTLMAEEFLLRTRNSPPDDVEFRGSEERVKRNYAKRMTTERELAAEVLPTEVAAAQEEMAATVVVTDTLVTSPPVYEQEVDVSTSDEIEEPPAVQELAESPCCGSTEEDEDLQERVEEEVVRSKGDDSTLHSKCRREVLSDTTVQCDAVNRPDKPKVVRYWMYEGPQPKCFFSSRSPDRAKQMVNESECGERPHKSQKRKAAACLAGTIPAAPKLKIPVIDARQAAMVVCQISTSPMVVYRGRCKKSASGNNGPAPQRRGARPRPTKDDGSVKSACSRRPLKKRVRFHDETS